MAGHFYNGRELELLIPASSLEVLKTAVIFGADAVYIGGEAFGPVSYTHLDVYKRQLWNTKGKRSCLC